MPRLLQTDSINDAANCLSPFLFFGPRPSVREQQLATASATASSESVAKCEGSSPLLFPPQRQCSRAERDAPRTVRYPALLRHVASLRETLLGDPCPLSYLSKPHSPCVSFNYFQSVATSSLRMACSERYLPDTRPLGLSASLFSTLRFDFSTQWGSPSPIPSPIPSPSRALKILFVAWHLAAVPPAELCPPGRLSPLLPPAPSGSQWLPVAVLALMILHFLHKQATSQSFFYFPVFFRISLAAANATHGKHSKAIKRFLLCPSEQGRGRRRVPHMSWKCNIINH